MQQQICPRCKFRLTSAKAICNTCGYALHSVRKPTESAPPPRTQQSANTAAASNVRKAQATAQSGGAGSFWRTFFGLDPLPSEKPES